MDTEQKIIKAAQSTFLKKGYGATSLIEIARKVNINKAMIHYYYRNKKNLYIHSASSIINEEIIPLIKEIASEVNIDNKRRLIDFFGKLIVKKYPWLIMILIDKEDPMHSELLVLLNKKLESYSDSTNQDTTQDNSLNRSQKAMAFFAFSLTPIVFEYLFKGLFHIEKSDYEKVVVEYHNQLVQIID